jgi:hypothetical protein
LNNNISSNSIIIQKKTEAITLHAGQQEYTFNLNKGFSLASDFVSPAVSGLVVGLIVSLLVYYLEKRYSKKRDQKLEEIKQDNNKKKIVNSLHEA